MRWSDKYSKSVKGMSKIYFAIYPIRCDHCKEMFWFEKYQKDYQLSGNGYIVTRIVCPKCMIK
jgi:hypothetical protein